MKKRILSLAMILLMTLALIPAAFASPADDLVDVIPPSPVFETETTVYTVLKGENLNAIAKKYGVTADQIKEWNKAYFDDLAARNAKQKTYVKLEAGANLTITSTKAQDLAYTVQKNENLWGIAFNYYGSMSKAKVDMIYKANAEYFKATKGVLEAGAVITLPGQGLIAPITQGSLENAAGLYMVKEGDTLSDLAVKYYGDRKEWKKIYEANKARVKLVGTNVAMIYPGQWLVIPA